MVQVHRWTFDDGKAKWTVPVNPDAMESPWPAQTETAKHTPGGGLILVPSGGGDGGWPVTWSFEGEAKDLAHLQKLRSYVYPKRFVTITDHAGYTILARLLGFKFTPKSGTANVHRGRYTVSGEVHRVWDPSTDYTPGGAW